MATILNDPFTTLANWTAGGTLVAGRTGNGMQVGGSSAPTTTIAAGPLRTNGQTVQFSWRTTNIASANRNICGVSSNGTVDQQLSVRALTTGAIQAQLGGVTGPAITASAAGLLTLNTWYTIEVAYHIADSPNGYVHIKIDGTTVATASGVDTRGAAATDVLDTFTLRGPGSGQSSIFDDFLLTTDDPTVTAAKLNVWNGSAFVDATAVKIWSGSAFVDALALKVWNGSAFVDAV